MAAQRPSIFARLTSVRNASLPPPAFCERRHRGLARLSIAVRRASILVVAEDQRPHPRASYGRRVGLEDAADSGAIGKHVVIVLIPLARRAARRSMFEGSGQFVEQATAIVPRLPARKNIQLTEQADWLGG
jgi:hypothetical protein